MYPDFERDLICKVATLQDGDIGAAGFFNEIINLFAENLDGIWEELSPLREAIRVKDNATRKALVATTEVQRQKVRELSKLSVPERLKTYLNDKWKCTPSDFWGNCIDDVVSSQPHNKISLLYTRVTSSTDDSNLYRRFAAVAIFHGSVRFADSREQKRITKRLLGHFIESLAQKVICNPIDDVEKDHIKEVFSSLQQAGSRWSRWAELVGGYGAFFVHPRCLTMSMVERNLNQEFLTDIANHLKSIGIESLAQDHNEVANGILKSVEVHLNLSRPERKRPSQCADEDITADTTLPGNRELQSRRKRTKIDRTRIMPQPEVHGRGSQPQETGCFGPTDLHPSLANHLVESDHCSYLANPYPQQAMNDPDLANPHPSLANHLVESGNYSYLYPQQAIDGSGATNTGLSSNSWFIPSSATAGGSEPQATGESCDDLQANISSSYPAGYPYHYSSFGTVIEQPQGYSGGLQVSPSAEASPHTSGSAHTEEVTLAKFLEVWEDGPRSGSHLSGPVSQGFDVIPSVTSHSYTSQQQISSGMSDYAELSHLCS